MALTCYVGNLFVIDTIECLALVRSNYLICETPRYLVACLSWYSLHELSNHVDSWQTGNYLICNVGGNKGRFHCGNLVGPFKSQGGGRGEFRSRIVLSFSCSSFFTKVFLVHKNSPIQNVQPLKKQTKKWLNS